jgi:hypothetical protein
VILINVNLRSGESENTFDMHSDRVWAIAVGQTGGTLEIHVFEYIYINTEFTCMTFKEHTLVF